MLNPIIETKFNGPVSQYDSFIHLLINIDIIGENNINDDINTQYIGLNIISINIINNFIKIIFDM
jgi:hypothetical protein